MLFTKQPNQQNKIFISNQKSYLTIFSIFLIFFSLAICINSQEVNGLEENSNWESQVIEIDDSSFPQFNKTNTKFYLYFYGEDCKKCKTFTPKFEKSSFLAKDNVWNVKYVKINADKNPKIKEHYNVTKLPEIFWANYEESDFHEYPGRLAPKALLKFINLQLNYTSEELVNWEQLETKKKNGKYLVFIGDIAKYKKAYERLVKVAKDEDIDVIMWTNTPDLLTKFGISQGKMDAVLISKKKTGIEIISNLGIDENTDVKELENLMEIYERKPYGKLNDYALLLSVEHNPPTPTVFLIYSSKNKTHSEYNSQISADLEKLGRKYRKEFHFMNASLSSNLITPLMAVFNVSVDEIPTLLMISHNQQYSDDVDKFIFPTDKKINEENVEQFLAEYKANKLPKVIFSDSLPENVTDENGVFNLVGYNAEDFVFRNTNKDVVLFFYSEFAFVNQEIAERFNRVVKKLKNNPNLVFAKANPIFNEIRNIHYEKLPSLYIIKGRNYEERIKNVVEYKEENFDTLSMIDFIKRNVANSISTIEALEDESKIFETEKETKLEAISKEKEEELIDFDEYNAGLRRYVRYLMDEQDEDSVDDEEPPKKKKDGNKKFKEDL